MIRNARDIARFLVFSWALLVPGLVSADAPRTIRVVVDNAYAPYSFQSDKGKLQGIVVDQWRAWERVTGIKVELQALDWDEALRRTLAGEFDVIDSIVENADREPMFDFTAPYATIEASIYFRRDIAGIGDLASLKGFAVAVKAGDQHADKLRANGVTSLIVYKNDEAIVEAAKRHTVNVFMIDDPSARYLLNKIGIADEFRHSPPVFSDELRRAVRKADATTLATVSKGFAAIDPAELRRIDAQWFGSTVDRYHLYLANASYAIAAALLLVAGLLAWNYALKRAILQRTAALAESERRFRQLAENVREVFWMATPRMEEILYVSPAYEWLWGRTCESLRRDPRSFLDAIHEDDRRDVAATVEKRSDREFELEYRVVRPDGSVRWIRDRGFPVRDERGNVYRVAGIAEDITERKRAQESSQRIAREIIDAIPTMAWSLTPEGTLDFVNRRWQDYTGLALEEAVNNGNAIMHPEDLEPAVAQWRSDMGAGKPNEGEMRLRAADGKYRWFLVRTVPLRDEHGHIAKWYGTCTDIEDQKRAADALRKSELRFRRMAAELQALSRRFVEVQESERRQLSRELHDRVGQNLTALKINLEVMVQVSPADRDVHARLADSVKLIDATIDTIDNVMSELRPPMLDDHGLASALQWHAREFSRRTGIAVDVRCGDAGLRLPSPVEIALFRIAQEALNNVAKHADAGHVDVVLDRVGGECVMVVEDDGIGLPENGGSREPDSSLGMVTMRERAEAVEGRLEVSGEPGTGTRVTARIPC